MEDHRIGITLSKENLDFSKFEVEQLFTSHEITYSDNLALLETDDLGELHDRLGRLSYGKKAFELLAHTEEWEDMLRDVEEADITQYAFPDESYKIDSLRIGQSHQSTDRGLLAGLTNTTGELQVDVENPDAEFYHIKGDNHTFGRHIWENDEPFTNRRNDKLPASHPTGMEPRLARAMVNIASPKNCVLDPFCGAGGILIEAGLLGHQLYGIDHDSRMIDRAKRNLGEFDLSAELVNGDATEETYPCDCVVTDIPYGKNSTTSNDPVELFGAFLDRVRSDTSRCVLCYPAKDSFQDIVDVVDEDASTFDFYVNASLTRRIALLKIA
jgi:tRNA (guanine10-N2)-dimethyltransferase